MMVFFVDNVQKKIYKHKNIILLLLIILLNFLLFLWAKSNWQFYYTMNDDVRMKSIITGEFSGMPDGHVLFIRYMLAHPLATMYSIFPQISWYNIMLEGTIFISLITICYRIFRINISKKGFLIGAFLYICFFLIFVLKNIIYPQFTVTAGFASITLVVILCTQEFKLTMKGFFKELALIVLFTYLGLTIRSNVFYMIIVFSIMPILIKCLKDRLMLKKHLIIGLSIFCMVGLVQIIEMNAYSDAKYKDYKEYNRARALVYDYLQFPEFNDNYDFYKEQGADAVVYNLLKEYNLRLDSRITKDFLIKMHEYQNIKYPKDVDKIKRLPKEMYEMIFTNTYTSTISYLFIIISLLTLIYSIKSKYYYAALSSLFCFLLVIVEIMFFVFTNRFPERILVPLVIVATIQQFILCAYHYKRKSASSVFKINLTKSILFVIVATLVSWLVSKPMLNITDVKKEKELAAKDTAYIDYAQQHKDNYYYNDAELYTGRLEVTFFENTTRLRNFMPDGGWGSGHPLISENMNAFSLTAMESDLLKNNVYFLSKKPLNYIENYYAYKNKIVIGEVIDRIENTEISVYKFREMKAIDVLDVHQKLDKNFLFSYEKNDLKIQPKSNVKLNGIMLNIYTNFPITINVDVNQIHMKELHLEKGNNYVFAPLSKDDIISIGSNDNINATIEKIILY